MVKRTLNGLLIALLVSSTAWGSTPTLVATHAVGRDMIYTYEVPDAQDPTKKASLYAMSNLPHALCSKALCTVDPNNPDKATCVCPIYGLQGDHKWQKASVGPHNIKETHPTTSKSGKLEAVTSNYSMANVKSHKKAQITCDFEKPTPWANCFGVRCRVEYNKKGLPHAICECPIVKTKKFVSIGPKNKDQCVTETDKIWSAAMSNQGPNNNFIMNAMYKKF